MTDIEQKATEILQLTNAFSIPVPVDLVAHRLGLDVEPVALGDHISGLLVLDGEHGSIGYNQAHSLARQRFTIAHELAHYVLHRQNPEHGTLFIDERFTVFLRDVRSSSGAETHEVEANGFAAALLMPATLLKKEVGEGIEVADEDALRTLADKFQVSTQALSIRLANLGLL